ncbi:MAG: exo-alpha-sialidase [Planctomycetales bacterium]|nr:exo-alpha-sialidase [Planctomycetales bacterium]
MKQTTTDTRFRGLLLVIVVAQVLSCAAVWSQDLTIDRDVIVQGDSDWDWTQARTATIPGRTPMLLTTMSRTAKVGSHGYFDVFISVSEDSGIHWSEPIAIDPLKRKRQPDGYDVVAGDLWPVFHAQTDKVLVTGKTFNFENGNKENILREQVAYAVIDPKSMRCETLNTVAMPKQDHAGKPIIAPNAGCHQRVHLQNGELLLPIRYQTDTKKRIYTSIVARCRFDGETLGYIEHGTEHRIDTGRGLYEPSVTEFGGEYFLTMRADDDAYVAKSSDGIHYSDHKPWTFDNGESLGSYHTQQHWVTLKGKLYLVYTRRGANNDHIMRHRAPLFIAQVDPNKLCVIRSTEQVIVPENHATLGNSGVCVISPREAWVTVAEGRVTQSERKGENNLVILAKITAP